MPDPLGCIRSAVSSVMLCSLLGRTYDGASLGVSIQQWLHVPTVLFDPRRDRDRSMRVGAEP